VDWVMVTMSKKRQKLPQFKFQINKEIQLHMAKAGISSFARNHPLG